MATSSPLVSIYLPTRGRSTLLKEAVESVLCQDYSELELIVVIDGPDQDSEGALEQYRLDRRVVVVKRGETGGACRARNDAIFQARGEFITGLDDDDLFLPRHLSGLVRALQSSGSAFACTTSVLRRPTGDQVRHVFSGAVDLPMLLSRNVVGNQVLTRTKFLRDIGGFDAEMPAWQDYDLWVRLCHAYGSGTRIDARTYIQRLDHSHERISHPDRIRKAHRRFVEKHAALLSERELLSLELLMHETTHSRFSLRQCAEYAKAGFLFRAIAALASDRLPGAQALARRILR